MKVTIRVAEEEAALHLPTAKREAKAAKTADSRKGKKPSREERGYSAARGPKGKDEWKQFFKDAEPDFSEEGWARRKPKKS